MFLTTKHQRREDPSQTKVVSDVTVGGAGHESIARDPRIRVLVMDKIERLRAAFVLEPLPNVVDPSAGRAPGVEQR
jgi:hypothetical protein